MIVEGGYIRVVLDVRGKCGSEGDYMMNRPLRGPQNATAVDHAIYTYDTIDWLVNNVPESNGKVGSLGISYDGFVTLMALVIDESSKISTIAGGALSSGTRAVSIGKTSQTMP